MYAPAASTVTSHCPECLGPVVTEYAKLPWCERCEWNLGVPDLDPLLTRGERFRARLSHGIAYDLTQGLFAGLQGRSAERPRRGGGFFVLLLISGLVLAVFGGTVAAGVWLAMTGTFFVKLAGALLIAFALVFRPRLGSVRKVLEEADVLTEEQAPEFFRLIRRTAEAIGAPMPHKIAIDAGYNASAGIIGPFRRRILLLGLPMLAVLRPQERVALLGHELGHYINRDSHRSLSTQPALKAFGTAARLLSPNGLRDTARGSEGLVGVMVLVSATVLAPFMYAASHLLWLCHLGVNIIGARVAQRAEYYADDLAARAGGSAAAASMMDVFVDATGFTTIIGARSRNQERADGWRRGVEKSRANNAGRMHRLRQLSIRTETGVFASHPPAGLRHRLIQSAPYRTAGVVLTAAESAAIDAELSAYEERYRREIAASW